MTPSEYRAAIKQVLAHWTEERFSEALELVDGLLRESPLSAELWVMRGNLLQLAPDDGPQDAVDHALETACILTPDFTEAQLEMGHYLYSVKAESDTALTYFERAEEQAEEALRDALIYQIKCLVELEQQDKANDIRAHAARRFPDEWLFTEGTLEDVYNYF